MRNLFIGIISISTFFLGLISGIWVSKYHNDMDQAKYLPFAYDNIKCRNSYSPLQSCSVKIQSLELQNFFALSKNVEANVSKNFLIYAQDSLNLLPVFFSGILDGDDPKYIAHKYSEGARHALIKLPPGECFDPDFCLSIRKSGTD